MKNEHDIRGGERGKFFDRVQDAETRTNMILAFMCELVPLSLDERGFKINRCVVSSRAGLELCKRFEIQAEPVVVNARAFNAAAHKHLARLVTMSEEEYHELGIRAIGIDTEKHDDAGFPAHLVLKVGVGAKHKLLDLNCGQFTRPELAVPAADAYHVTSDFWTAPLGTWQDFYLQCGGSIGYARMETPFDYTTSIDWATKAAWFATVRDVAFKIETVLKHIEGLK